MANLPHELVDEILLRLPVKSLLRFKCVCNAFYDSIGSQSFVNSHFKRCSKNRNHCKQIDLGLDMTTDYNSWKIRALEFNDDLEKELVLEIPRSTRLLGNCLCYFSYCNGLVLLYIDKKISIWNPSTRKYRILPELFPEKHIAYLNFGLGYDSTSDDYKVVVIVRKIGSDTTGQVWIFELRSSSRSWRRIQNFPYNYYNIFIDGGNGDCFVDGALHFICRGGEEYEDEFHIIVAFDVAKETFSIVDEPVYPIEVTNILDLSVFRGCLSVCHCNMSMDEGRVDTYVRKKEGVNTFTWTRLYAITTQQFSKEEVDLFKYARLAYSMEGDKVLVSTYKKLHSYDIKEKTLQEIVTANTSYIFHPRHIFSCTETLMSIGS